MVKYMKKKYYIFELGTTSFLLNFILIIIFAGLLFLSYLINPNILSPNIDIAMFIICLFGYFLLHELLHSIGYVINGASFNKIVYGIKLEKGVFYCLCKQNISKKNISYSSIYPLFFIGILTYIIGIIFNFPLLVILSAFNISGSVADIFTFLFIRKLKDDIEFTEMDNPLYFAIYADYDVSKVKHTCLNFIKSCKDVKREDFKKITISKPSYIILGIAVVYMIIMKLL